MSKAIELRLFSHPEVRLNGQPLASALPHKALALLYYLALAEQPVAREKLALLLWPDVPLPAAKQSLRNALSQLRPAVGDLLEISHHTVALDATYQQQADVLAFQHGLAALQQLQQQGQPPDLALWQATLDLYRGDFLDGFDIHQSELFAEWTTLRRKYLRSQLITNLLALSGAYAANAAPEAALACLDRLLAIDPENETAYSQQIQLLLRLGRRTEAQQGYERYRQMLDAEFGILPAAALTALVTDLRTLQDDSEPRIQRTESGSPTPVKEAASPPRVPTTIPTHKVQPTIPNNLARPLSAFVGRGRELAHIAQRLADPTCRLVTIVGPGGIGKTALALALGQHLLALQQTDFPDGIFWTPLAEINGNDPEGEMPPDGAYEVKAGEAIVRAIAAQISDELGVDLASTSQLHTYLRTRRLLLIVDNFEHLLAGADALVALLQKAPQVKMVITSRARLNLRGETVLALDRLSLPADSYHAALVAAQSDPTYAIADEVWQASEAVSMFVQRTRQVDPTFTINAATIGPVGQICRLVEGLPLGIELATSMLPVLSCTALAKDLAQSLDVLAADTRDLPRDQRTLRAVFERSWRLLTPDAQLLLARLSLFPASFRREAAEYIVGASRSLLQQLLNQSLVSKAGEERFTLHHIVHAFAQQKLQQRPEQVAAIQVQYAHYYLELLARLEPELTGAAYASATEQIEADLDNVQTAWRWALTYRMVTELNHCLTALYFFSEQQRYNWEVIDLYEEALRHLAADQAQRQEEASDETTLLIGRLQTYLGARCVRLGRFLQAQTAYESAWSILQEADHPDAAALCLGFWGGLLRRSDPHRSVDLLTEGLRLLQNTDETWLKALAYQMLGEIDLLFGNYAEAEAQLRRGYALAQQLATTRGLVSALKSLGRISLCLGHYRQAEAHLREAIGYARQYHLNLLRLESTTALGEALRLQGRIDDAQQCFVESRTISKELDAEVFIAAVLLWEEACLAEQCGQYATAKRQFSESLAIGLPPWWSHVLPTLGWALIGLDELDEGYAYFQAVLAKAQSEERLPVVLDARVGLICIEWLRSLQSRPANPAWVAETQSALHELDRHPATAAETRQRIAQIVQQFAPHLPEKPSAEAPDAFLNRPWQTATHPQSGSPTVVDTPG